MSPFTAMVVVAGTFTLGFVFGFVFGSGFLHVRRSGRPGTRSNPLGSRATKPALRVIVGGRARSADG